MNHRSNLNDDEIVYDINYKELLLNLLHEAHVISNVLSSCSTIITKSISGGKIDKPTIETHAYQIFENAYLLSLWLNITEFEINPSYFESQSLIPNTSLFGKFKRAGISFKRLAKSKKVRVSVVGTSTALLNLYPIIDILPYLLLDNALKYSPNDGDIEIGFIETIDLVSIKISSIGPVLRPGEVDRVFEKGFRGHEASRAVEQGSGRGLALVEHVCAIHKAEIKIETGPEEFAVNGIPYSNFTVIISFPRH